jgi:rubrerythrin
MTANDLVGASVIEDRLFRYFNQHVAEEQDLIDAYSTLAEQTDSKAFAYLARLIVDDEAKHHRIFGELVNAVRAEVEFRDVGPQVPPLGGWGSDPQAVLAATENFLRRERDDARQLKRLDKEMRDFRDTTLWSLLVKMMEADTDKHIRILEFIRDGAKHRVKNQPR